MVLDPNYLPYFPNFEYLDVDKYALATFGTRLLLSPPIPNYFG